MDGVTEIVFGDSIYHTMLECSNNKILKFNTIFSISDLSVINDYKVILPSNIYKKDTIYNFSEQIKVLNESIENKDKIRIWCSHKDSDSYIL